MRAGVGIFGRFFLHAIAVVAVVLGAVLVVAWREGRRAAAAAEQRALEQAVDLTAQLLAGRGRSLAGGARVFVQGPYFRALVAEGRRDDILDQAFEAAEQLGADWVFITDEHGTLLAKSDEPAVQGAPMGSIPLVAGALEGRTVSGFGVSGDSLLFQTIAVPIVVPGAAPVGVLVATKVVDAQLARDIRAATGGEVVFYALDLRGAPHVTATSLADARQGAAALPPASNPAQPAGARRARLGERSYALHGAALTTAGGEIVGGFVIARADGEAAAGIAGIRRALLAAAVLGLLLALGVAWNLSRQLRRPALAVAAAAGRALEGDYDGAARAAAGVRAGRDEVGVLVRSVVSLLRELREKRTLGAVLGRDLVPPERDAPAGAAATGAARDATARLPAARSRATAVSLSRPALHPATSLARGALVAERYRIQALLGQGGTGIVYRATDEVRGETVALKLLRPELLDGEAMAREELRHELRLARRIAHRNVVRIHDIGCGRDVPFLAMECVEGASLAAVLARRGALPEDTVLALAAQLLRALEAAHAQGVIHADLKPANILLAADGLVKVTDFGVATLARQPRGAPVTPPHLAGATVGTPEYMAPELLLGGAPDVRSDLYAAGTVLHECLTGDTPFPRDTPRAFLASKLESAPREHAPRAAGPTRLQAIVAWMTAAAPAERPASAAEVSARLAQLL